MIGCAVIRNLWGVDAWRKIILGVSPFHAPSIRIFPLKELVTKSSRYSGKVSWVGWISDIKMEGRISFIGVGDGEGFTRGGNSVWSHELFSQVTVSVHVAGGFTCPLCVSGVGGREVNVATYCQERSSQLDEKRLYINVCSRCPFHVSVTLVDQICPESTWTGSKYVLFPVSIKRQFCSQFELFICKKMLRVVPEFVRVSWGGISRSTGGGISIGGAEKTTQGFATYSGIVFVVCVFSVGRYIWHSGRRQDREVFLSFTQLTSSLESEIVVSLTTHSRVVVVRTRIRPLVSVRERPWLRWHKRGSVNMRHWSQSTKLCPPSIVIHEKRRGVDLAPLSENEPIKGVSSILVISIHSSVPSI